MTRVKQCGKDENGCRLINPRNYSSFDQYPIIDFIQATALSGSLKTALSESLKKQPAGL
ncbi:MAG: hypothetical protein IIA75_04840 [Proteobacteria bacterium]|nr:hypothetical protein [Pseudomonadota bacterium]